MVVVDDGALLGIDGWAVGDKVDSSVKMMVGDEVGDVTDIVEIT